MSNLKALIDNIEKKDFTNMSAFEIEKIYQTIKNIRYENRQLFVFQYFQILDIKAKICLEQRNKKDALIIFDQIIVEIKPEFVKDRLKYAEIYSNALSKKADLSNKEDYFGIMDIYDKAIEVRATLTRYYGGTYEILSAYDELSIARMMRKLSGINREAKTMSMYRYNRARKIFDRFNAHHLGQYALIIDTIDKEIRNMNLGK